jgi:endoglucanase
VLASAILTASLLAALDPAFAADTPPEQVTNGDFQKGTTNWSWYGVSSAGVVDGEMCATVPAGLTNYWDAGVLQDLPLASDSPYTLSFRAHASVPGSIRVVAQLGSTPYTTAWERTAALGQNPNSYSYTFTSPLDTQGGQLAFQIGSSTAENTICLDDVSLLGGKPRAPYVPETGSRVRVNQVGYLPDGPKRATVVTDAADGVPWKLKTSSGRVVATGTAKPWGIDEASGQRVQVIDFSRVTRSGTGYTLTADGTTSYPFDLSTRLYRPLRADTMQYFYLQRSGIPIDGNLVGEQYARPAGHLGVSPNLGDTDVGCVPGQCDYRLDVRGGWYDAGDQGKYVINGGIVAYQLMSIVERASGYAPGSPALTDGSLRVPERGNGVPDVLDEARWGIEFLLRMQVPAGQPLAGMAHHKMHDKAWTDLPTLPHLDSQPRELHQPTTAATLNLAAVGAQCARVYARYDAAFAAKCLTAARTAYDAAKANPSRYAPIGDDTGGGSYSDDDATDEFYWAAAELYLTTRQGPYLADVVSSPHHTATTVFDPTGFGWLHTAALGRMDLATLPSALPDRPRVRKSVVDAANTYLEIEASQAYGLPLPGTPGSYFWGSNSNIVNNLVVVGTAYDLTGDRRFLDGTRSGIDYVFGRNGLNHSYVAGWGDKTPLHSHHRWYARDLDPSLPVAPAGMLVGGANTQANDPPTNLYLTNCEPQLCYIDDIRSYSTNESSINYVSALAWVAAFLDD